VLSVVLHSLAMLSFIMSSDIKMSVIMISILVDGMMSMVLYKQCDLIGRNFNILATLGYFLHNKFSNRQAVLTHGLL
jgi:hypothetical protein